MAARDSGAKASDMALTPEPPKALGYSRSGCGRCLFPDQKRKSRWMRVFEDKYLRQGFRSNGDTREQRGGMVANS
jgi:hypothetical protein